MEQTQSELFYNISKTISSSIANGTSPGTNFMIASYFVSSPVYSTIKNKFKVGL